MLQEKTAYYYGDQKKNCAQSILLAAKDEYKLDVSDAEVSMLTGFGGGMGCKSTCGALTGCIAVLSKLYGTREDVRALCGAFVDLFHAGMGCDSINCADIEAKYRTEEARCTAGVTAAAAILAKYIDKIEGREEKAETKEECTVSAADIKRVKGIGFLQHVGTNKFNGRIITRNGRITNEEAETITEAAKLFGDGHMMFTTRLTIEVSGIDYENIEPFREYVGRVGLETGGTGSKVRPVVSCKGSTCQYGLYDTYALSEKIHDRFYKGYANVSLPHKFKIACGGCPNNCVKPNLNDLGIVGARIPNYDSDKCRGCKKCQIEAACPIKIAKVTDGKMVIDPDKCNKCGRCVGKCPFKCIEDGTYGWKIFIGGRWGKRIAQGQMLSKIFTDEQEVLDTVEKAILLFRSEGITGERFADTIARLGFEKCEQMLLSNELLEKKNEILGLNVVGGASC